MYLSVCSRIGILNPVISKTDVDEVTFAAVCWGKLFWTGLELLTFWATGWGTCWTGWVCTTCWDGTCTVLDPFLVKNIFIFPSGTTSLT